jgi:hypothetical protein
VLSSAAHAAAEPTMHQIYEAATTGHLGQAQEMISLVLANHPKSSKALHRPLLPPAAGYGLSSERNDACAAGPCAARTEGASGLANAVRCVLAGRSAMQMNDASEDSRSAFAPRFVSTAQCFPPILHT